MKNENRRISDSQIIIGCFVGFGVMIGFYGRQLMDEFVKMQQQPNNMPVGLIQFDEKEKLVKQLRQAVAIENYEEAARLRDLLYAII